jgi:ribosome maturation factor RimP
LLASGNWPLTLAGLGPGAISGHILHLTLKLPRVKNTLNILDPQAPMLPWLAHVKTLIEPEIARLGYELVRLVHMGGESRAVLQVMAETPEGTFDMADCVRLSHALSDLLDANEAIIPMAYRLEVSSPGIDRPLTRPKDFARWQGFDARVTLSQAVQGRKRLEGRLGAVDAQGFTLQLEGQPLKNQPESLLHIPFTHVESAKLILTDALIAATTPTGHARLPDDPLDHPPKRPPLHPQLR